MELHDFLGSVVGITHVHIVVAVVAHEHDDVLPVAGVAVLGVGYGLVDEHLGLGIRHHGEAPHGHVNLIGHSRAYAFALVEQAEEAVVYVATGFVVRVLALESQQVVVGVEAATVGGEHTVVPHAVAEEQQKAWPVGIRSSPVVEHLQVAAVGIGIGRAARELVVELVGRHYAHPHLVEHGVEVGQALCLSEHLLVGGDYYHHVGRAVGMMVLVGYGMEYFGDCEAAGEQTGCRGWRAVGDGY